MAKDFRPIPQSEMLFPVDPREYLPENDFVYLVQRVVNKYDLSSMEDGYVLGGADEQAYDPELLTTLLLYAYCQGEHSSRRIDRWSRTDAGYRVACGNRPPDHLTIARFRRRYEAQIAKFLGQFLMLCAAAGMHKVGVVSLDGLMIPDSSGQGRPYSRSYLAASAALIVAEAGRIDAAEDKLYGKRRGDELPDYLLPGPECDQLIARAIQQITQESQTDRAVEPPKESAPAVRHRKEPPDQDMLPELGASPN